jgi:hypothetical protein
MVSDYAVIQSTQAIGVPSSGIISPLNLDYATSLD